MRRLGKTSKKVKFEKNWSYQKAKLLKTLTLTEEEIMGTTCDRDSLHEIESKHNPGATRGLLHIKESDFYCTKQPGANTDKRKEFAFTFRQYIFGM